MGWLEDLAMGMSGGDQLTKGLATAVAPRPSNPNTNGFTDIYGAQRRFGEAERSAAQMEYYGLQDPNSANVRQGYQLGGDPNGFARQADAFNGMATGIADRNAYGAMQDWDRMGQGSRGAQNNGLELFGQMAMGNGPSAAQAQLGLGNMQAIQAQQAMAASARGGGSARAAAQGMAATNAAGLMAQNGYNAAMLRAQEQQTAAELYGRQGTAMRTADNAVMGLYGDAANANDASVMKYRELGYGVGSDAMAAEQKRQAMAQAWVNGQNAKQAQESNVDQASKNRVMEGVKVGADVLKTAISGGSSNAMKVLSGGAG